MPIGSGVALTEARTMIETSVDYWTCIDLAEALEQTMRNDLWSTAKRIAETASRIGKKPDELIAALKKYEIHEAATAAASEVTETTVTRFTHHTNGLSKAG